MNYDEYFTQIKCLYNALSDDLSKQIFMSRLQYNLEPSLENADKFLSIADDKYKLREDKIKSLLNRKLYFYGAGYYGVELYNKFRLLNANVCGFFDKSFNKYANLHDVLCYLLTTDISINLSEKLKKNIDYNYNIPIFQPPTSKWVELNRNEDYIICVTTKYYFDEIKDNLIYVGVPEDRIINLYKMINVESYNQYFEFMEYYNGDGAFIDAGCFDGTTLVQFAHLCGNNYTRIYAFEPDLKNIELCNKNAEFINLNNVILQSFGLGSQTKEVKFSSGNGLGSRISDKGNTIINITTIDETVKDEKISFIKMDIEGAELDALNGAQNTIKRDKPFCAISIYHKPDDIITIIQYLRKIVPEYKFKIRHYTMCMADTVLYAYI